MKPLATNTLLQNRYLIVHLIGKGGMGDVYLAIDQRLGSAVALKRTFFSGDEIFAAAFEREARTLARLRHNVLPKVSDHFIEEDTQYLIMEHISGEDLSKRLEISQKPFPVDWVMFWADQLLDALNYLHSQEPPVIHRDIKPQNLKLTDENTIVLLDFGLSKNTISETPTATTGSVVGYTPHFAPMEQIRGMGTNPRSDIYSLSATLYQLLTNVVPPETLIRAEDLLGGKPDPIKPIHEINGEVSQEISDVIFKGMAVSQEHRFSNAREMQKALREAFTQTQNTKQSVAAEPENQNKSAGISQPQLKTNVSVSQPESKSAKSFRQENQQQSEKIVSQTPVSSSRNENSDRKFLRIISLGIPFVLAITAGIGWFILYDSEAATKQISAPTPLATAVAPTIERTPEPTPVSSENTANANVSNEENLISNTNDNVDNQKNDSKIQNSVSKNGKSTEPAVIKTAPKSLQRAQNTTKATPKPTPSPKNTSLPKILLP